MIVKREVECNLMIKEVFEAFNISKRAQGMNDGSYYYELKRFLKDMELTESDYISIISEEMFNEWVCKLKDTGLSISSVNHYITSMRVFLYYAMNDYYLKPFKIRLVKGQEQQVKAPSREEVELLLNNVNKDNFCDYRTYAIICFILSTGARSSTIRNIHIDDIDFVQHTVTYRHLKTKQIKTIPLTSQIERILRDYIKFWDTQSDFLFCDIRGNQLTPNALKLSFIRYCKRRNVREILPHSIRHFFAKSWIIKGGDSMILQQMLCHNNISTTQKYVRLFADDIRKANFEDFVALSDSSKSRTKLVRRAVWVINFKLLFGKTFQ